MYPINLLQIRFLFRLEVSDTGNRHPMLKFWKRHIKPTSMSLSASCYRLALSDWPLKVFQDALDGLALYLAR